MKQLKMNMEDYNALNHALPTTEIFSSLSVPETERLIEATHMWGFSPGETIIKQGGKADALYILREGTVAVSLKRIFFLPEKVLLTLGPPQVFGEMSLIERRPHTASVRAITPVRVFVMLLSAFDLLCRENPAFKRELDALAERRNFQNRHS